MAFSLGYAFGKAGRHVRTIATQAREFIKAQRATLPHDPLVGMLYKQSLAIDCILFEVFYSEPGSSRYSIHRKYLPHLLEVTESGYRRLSQAYASALLVDMPLNTGGEEELKLREAALWIISRLYEAREPESHWLDMAYRPDKGGIVAALLRDIAAVLRLRPDNNNEFATDWLSLVPSMDNATKMVLNRVDG